MFLPNYAQLQFIEHNPNRDSRAVETSLVNWQLCGARQFGPIAAHMELPSVPSVLFLPFPSTDVGHGFDSLNNKAKPVVLPPAIAFCLRFWVSEGSATSPQCVFLFWFSVQVSEWFSVSALGALGRNIQVRRFLCSGPKALYHDHKIKEFLHKYNAQDCAQYFKYATIKQEYKILLVQWCNYPMEAYLLSSSPHTDESQVSEGRKCQTKS
ncbi:hypothetical protein B0H19DRAFT_1062842 [Mycena capillaripes]|nr:hypothetical protein B0H19DRAFT_1062842 [Mycena capillaripes]